MPPKPAAPTADTPSLPPRPSLAARFTAALRRRPLAVVGGLIILVITFCALFADIIAPGDPTAVDVRNQLCTPSADHLLGCDENGRDVLTLLIYGSRVALVVGLSSVALSL